MVSRCTTSPSPVSILVGAGELLPKLSGRIGSASGVQNAWDQKATVEFSICSIMLALGPLKINK